MKAYAKINLALLVGVKKYQKPLDPLEFTENDVLQLGKRLADADYKSTILCDSNGAKDKALLPTRANILAQFKALLSEDLWRDNADRANQMATRMATSVARIPGVTIAYPVEANGVFATLPGAVTEQLQGRFPFYVWDPRSGVVRWMTSFDTTEEDVDEFVELVANLMTNRR